jgi:hypothetical protein
MERYALKDVPLRHFMAASEHLVRQDAEGKYTYNLILNDPDGTRIEKDRYWLTFENGKITFGEGHLDDPEATEFTVLQGGLDTLLAMQVHGLKAAMNAMMLGYITASNLKKAEAWFKILETGEAAVVESLRKAGVEITDTSLDIYGELGLG